MSLNPAKVKYLPWKTRTKKLILLIRATRANQRRGDTREPAKVAEHIGTSLTQVRRWEGGQTAPSIDNAVLLARFYHVSLDRICGLQDRPDLDLEGLDKEQIEALKAVVVAFKR